ncbi:fused MFS/spermidine synthase [Bosea sp. ANAM02]|uniref:fused MFS/spermidine synthase n=1 Tax=Bosea sp. ANAM02 TaxID=2020412 RepID=UPI00140ED800|nr:fused MFS/spermidine synthase [Bosea sp. ANAM02]BCB21209.1 hypothetical protein OCUBac02_41030 [Bosea sp. ANAM02]
MIAALLLAEALTAFCALAFETATARLVAPHAGLSTDSWTAIIAGFLLSWALGNHLGGTFARDSARLSLFIAATAILSGAAAIALTPAMLPILDEWIMAPDPLARWRAVMFAAVPTLLPGFLLGIAPPLLMLAIIARGGGPGALVGLANAAGAAGSAAGAVSVLWFGLDLLGARGTCLAIGALGALGATLVAAAACFLGPRQPA